MTKEGVERGKPLQSISSSGVESPRIVSLFSGIGGLDLGLAQAGGVLLELCESWEPARRVLRDRFPGIKIAPDVRDFVPTEPYDVLNAGFPCVDLSHAGAQAGIFGPSSGLVSEVFRIAEATKPEWIIVENVPNLLRLGRGAGIRYIIESLENLGYSWAYRVLDSRAFGVPQRRNRVIVLASLSSDPAAVLLCEDSAMLQVDGEETPQASGFYWTEGRRGVGLVEGAVPTLKGGSTLGLPSAPAIWMPAALAGRKIVLPSLEDAEELQGFPRGWSVAADIEDERSFRWKLVGNAVTVGLAKWLGQRLALSRADMLAQTAIPSSVFDDARPWPDAAYGGPGKLIRTAQVSRMPQVGAGKPLHKVIEPSSLQPLSFRATRGFLARIEESGNFLNEQLLSDLEEHLSAMRPMLKPSAKYQTPKQPERAARAATESRKPVPGTSKAAEELLRRALSDRGLRYRLQARPETSQKWRADIVFSIAKVVVDIRDCFWHSCTIHQKWPNAKTDKWATKLHRIQAQDKQMVSELSRLGWSVVVVWAHQDAELTATDIAAHVNSRRTNNVTHIGQSAAQREEA